MYRCFPIASAKVGLFLKLPNYSRKNFLIIFDGFSFLFRLCIDNQFLIYYFIFWRKNDFFLR
ncbi:hypothetical protein F2Z85_02835 [Bacteroides fragilis]|uniref:Uncharacterized protein n=1 Tax=Bacteroides fragilis TaxID=817 RepID=A0A5C6HDY8_BACFG|nr:hypothetical protein F3B20_05965 [Bacteroides fragilis]KAA4799158.1 hypothetical protein F3B17_14535 [Bacteroides fragilis]KAA4803654.1 hypothetical protein F2045_09300 [Bacteroides fragilis]KAA4809529.1 hypothetical protein F2048_05485 [Bacteroides fragilis]KAA4816365.1 hypothetical protein F2050_03880 [Bacteroides fragilis]